MGFLSNNPGVLEAHRRIDNGDSGILQTVADMRKQMAIAKHDIRIQDLVNRLTMGLQTQTQKSQALAQWFTENVRYANDTDWSLTEQGLQPISLQECPASYEKCEEVEILNKPERVLFYSRHGDCDDFVMALGTMHELAGIRIQIVIIAADARNPREFSHVYFRALLDGKWVPIDPVNRAQPWGWEHTGYTRREVFA